MSVTTTSRTDLRAAFAVRLAETYGREVPAYTTLVEVAREVNADHAARESAAGRDVGRLGSLERVTAERHGAIRLGSPREMAQVARLFAGFGMHPVGFYDLRDASATSVPVVSTAFRPTDPEQLAANPFRVFTSMLVTEDRRFFDTATRARLEDFVADRALFGPRLLELADRSAADDGLSRDDADELLEAATAVFELSPEPVDQAWYEHLAGISAVAADIGGVASTHVNHLTPRVLDIDDLYARMGERGITMIDEVQGPPAWEGPDVLLRQTSFKALAEQRLFRHPDGHVAPGSLRVRFGEVEQRGIALTPAGRERYDAMVARVDDALAGGDPRPRADVAREVWREHLPATEAGLAQAGLAFFTYSAAEDGRRPRAERDGGGVGEGRSADGAVGAVGLEATVGPGRLAALVADGAVVREPIVYEDFLPRSAAGIFASNVEDDGARDDDQAGADYDLARLSGVVEADVADPMDLCAAQADASVRAALAELSRPVKVEGALRR